MIQFIIGVIGAAAFTLMVWDLVTRRKKPDRFVIAMMALFEVAWFIKHAYENYPL